MVTARWGRAIGLPRETGYVLWRLLNSNNLSVISSLGLAYARSTECQLLCPAPHRMEALSDNARLTSVPLTSDVCRIHRA